MVPLKCVIAGCLRPREMEYQLQKKCKLKWKLGLFVVVLRNIIYPAAPNLFAFEGFALFLCTSAPLGS